MEGVIAKPRIAVPGKKLKGSPCTMITTYDTYGPTYDGSEIQRSPPPVMYETLLKNRIFSMSTGDRRISEPTV